MNNISRLNFDAANSQSYEFFPLITLRLPTGNEASDDAGRTALYLQIHDREKPFEFEGETYNYVEGSLDHMGGSQIPFSAYRYSFTLRNTAVTSIILTNDRTISDLTLPSPFQFTIENDGLRDGNVQFHYHYPGNPDMDSEGVYRIENTIFTTESITFILHSNLDRLIPSRTTYGN